MGNKRGLTDDQVEREIKRLLADEDVKLARAEERMRTRRRQYMYQLRMYKKRGKELSEAGVTYETIAKMKEIKED